MFDPQNILIVRLSSIGDVVLTTPLVRSVRTAFPQARITFLVKKQFADLVKHNPHIDEVLAFDSKSESISELCCLLKAKKFDWCIDIHKNLRTAYLKLFVGFSKTTTYSKQTFKRRLLVNFRSNLFSDIKPVYLRYFGAVEKLGMVYDGLGTEVFFTLDDTAFVNEKLVFAGCVPSQSLIVLAPGASYSNKQWLPDRFAETANQLAMRHGAFIALIGGKADKDLCDQISLQITGAHKNFAGKLSLLQSAALLQKAKLAITNDSGMMHLAQSQKTPLTAIFGATSKELGFFPIPEKSVVVEKSVRCRPCTPKGLNYCPKKHFRCMRLIEVQDVLQASDEVLAIVEN